MKKEPINILIVEDNEAHIELARRAFESRAGAFSVTVAHTLKEARAHLAASTPGLMFVDLTLPDGNGIELLADSDSEPGFPAIILTVSSDVQQAVGAMKAGALDYVIKSDDTFADLPHIAERALREWDHIIERRRSEDKIRRQHDFLRNTIESLSHPFCVIDANDYTIKIANTVCGFSDPRENVTCYALTHKHDKPCHYFDEQCPIEIVKATKKPAIVEHTHYDKSGSFRVYEVHAHPIFDDSGNVVQIIEYLLDITERKKATEELVKLRLGMERSGEAIFMTDIEGKIQYINPGFEKLYGFSSEEAVGKTPRILKSGTLNNEVYKQFWETLLAGKVMEGEIINKTKDGRLLNIDSSANPILDESGDIIGFLAIQRDITARKQVEEALRESEEKYRQLFTTETDAIMLFDAETRQFLDVNDAAVQMYGYNREEFLKLKHIDITAEPEASEDSIKKMLAGVPATGFTCLHKRKDGTILPVEISSSSFNLKGRSVLCGIVRDITERKNAEDALRLSEERFYRAFNSSPDAIVLCSLEGPHPEDIIFVNVNESFEKLSGYSREEVIGKRTLDVKIFWDDKDQFRQYEFLQKYGRVRNEECVFRSKSGDEIIGDFSSEIFYLAGKLYGVIVVRDITASKAAEEALRESEEKYKGLVENIEIGISLISPQMEILSLNRKMQEWFPRIDTSKRPLCYESYSDPPKEEICPYCPAVKTFEDGQVHEAVSETPAGDEIKNYRIVSSPIKDVAGNVVAVIEMVEDVTEKLRLEKERDRAGRLESIGILAGGIAHDFNNILAGFLGSVSRAKMDLNPGSETYRALERAETASIRAERLTDQLLTFSRGGAPIKEKASVAELVRDTAGFTLSGSNVGCEFLIPDNIWEAKIDKGQISQVVQNLVINAAQAMPGGGKIVISVENLQLGPGQPVPLDKGKYVKISVRDHGIGIPDDYLQKIFDPYFTTKQRGSGLGLATVYSIVKNHDGHIDVSSEPGEGTTFDVYLPSTGKVPSKERPVEAKIVHGTGKVLVVDDEEIIRITLGDILAKIGYEVQCVSDGQEAIELFNNERDRGRPFDIVILDLTIPGGMGGKEAIVKLREIDPDVKAVVSSGYATDPVVATFKEHGFSGYLKKPYKASDLSMVLGDILQGESAG